MGWNISQQIKLRVFQIDCMAHYAVCPVEYLGIVSASFEPGREASGPSQFALSPLKTSLQSAGFSMRRLEPASHPDLPVPGPKSNRTDHNFTDVSEYIANIAMTTTHNIRWSRITKVRSVAKKLDKMGSPLLTESQQ